MTIKPRSLRLMKFLIVSGFTVLLAILPTPLASADQLFFSDKDTATIHRMNHDGSGLTTILSAPTLSDPRGLAIDPFTHTLYFSDWGTNSIRSSNFDGSNVQTIYSGLSAPSDIEIDTTNGHIYWAERDSNTIRRGSLDGIAPPQTLISSTQPYYLDVDPSNNILYWSQFNSSAIFSSNLSGNNLSVFVNFGDRLRDMVADPDNNTMYWNDRDDNVIRRADLDTGGNIATVYSVAQGLDRPHGLALGNGALYWTDTSNSGVFSAPANGSGPVLSLNTLGRDGPWDIEIFSPIPEPTTVVLLAIPLLACATRRKTIHTA